MNQLTKGIEKLKLKTKTIKVHTHKDNVNEVIEILKKIELKYKIVEKKYKKDIYKTFEWYNLPSFKYIDDGNRTIQVFIENDKKDIFYKSFNSNETKLSYINYKKKEHPYKNYEYVFTHTINPRYPIYVISKGRWDKRYTINSLEEMGVNYKVVIEPSEYEKYNQYIKKENILILPNEYLNKNQGGIPARNFVWEHSTKNGFNKHWIIDDNIDGFYRWNYNKQKKIKSGVFFRVLEDYVDRYDNVLISSPQSLCFPPESDTNRNMIIVNSRCYSCILIDNKKIDKILNERWRGRYNEDTDLTLRILEKGYCSLLFNNFLINKKTSGSMKGGNTDSIYDGGSHKGYQDKFDELYNNWKHIEGLVKLTTKKHKDGRPHHHINYTKHFTTKTKLIKPEKYIRTNEYNMVFIDKSIIEQDKEDIPFHLNSRCNYCNKSYDEDNEEECEYCNSIGCNDCITYDGENNYLCEKCID